MGDMKVFFHSILLMTSQSVQYLIYGNLISPRDDVGQWQYYCHCCTTDNLAITVAIVHQVVRILVTSNGHQRWFKYF